MDNFLKVGDVVFAGDSIVEPIVSEISEPFEPVSDNILDDSNEKLVPPSIDTLKKDEDDVWKF